MAMLIQIPDKFYHTSEDTLDKIDASMLAQGASLAAGFAYFIASAGPADAAWLAHEMDARFRAGLTQHLQVLITKAWSNELQDATRELERRISYRLDVYLSGLQSIERLWAGIEPLLSELRDKAKAFADGELERGRWVIKTCPYSNVSPKEPIDEWEQKASTLIPARRYRGPASFDQLLRMLPNEEQEDWRTVISSQTAGGNTIVVLAEYWADGQRTALEIVDLIELETGVRNAELVVRFFGYLERLGLVLCSPERVTPTPR